MKTLYFLFFTCFLLPFYSDSQIINTFAGNGVATYSGDGGAATSASLSRPISCVMDNVGDLLISDFANNRIRKVSSSGIITTIAGTGTPGFSGDGGPAIAAEIQNPEKITVDGAGNIYFCDFNNQRVRKINTSGVITTIAGTGAIGYTGDGGPATAATFWNPGGIAIDAIGNIYITDEWNNRIRKINTSGIISTIAGDGPTGYLAGGFGGDGAAATTANINFPVGITVSATGSIIFSDDGNSRVREISTTGIINTIAGNGIAGSTGDGGAATLAELNGPEGVTVDPAGNVYICETAGNRVRKIDASGIINTLAGNGTTGFSGDGAAATAAELDFPEGVFVDTITSCVYICDASNNRVRRVGTCETPAGSCNLISIPDTLNLCMADTITLPAIITGSDSILNITWTPSTGLSSTTIVDPVLTTTTPGWYYITVNNLIPDNLVVNGSFTAGNTGFTTGYTPEGYASTSTPGYYAVDTDPVLYDAAWPAMGDHTTGTGNMLIVDGSYTSGESFWCETISVLANTNYVFTVWTALLHDPLPTLQLTINGVNISTFTTSSTSALWQQYQITWNSGTATSASICMSDLATSGYGNDFAIDDISFQQLCVAKDSVYITICAPVIPACDSISLPDSLHLCEGDTATIHAILIGPDSLTSINWTPVTGLSNSTILNPVITATTSGWYRLTINSLTPACTTLDSVYIQIISPDTSLNHVDTSICSLTSAISLFAPAGYITPLWNMGATTSSVVVNDSGIYWVKSVSSCTLLTDTFHINSFLPGRLFLESDSVVCAGNSITLNAPAIYTEDIWNTGNTTVNITVNAAGSYWVTDTNFIDCTTTVDTFNVTITPLPVISLGNDTSICQGDSITLSSPGTLGTYLWGTGSTATSITVSGGVFMLTVTNNGCSTSDSIRVTQLMAPLPINLGPDTILCLGDPYVLSSGADSVLWSTGMTAISISITDSGTYWASVANMCGTSVDSVNINFELCNLTFPSAFTPNGDGRNDIAHAIGSLALYRDYNLSIYNRFGQRVFYTEDIYSGWNGIYDGAKADLGTYFYVINFTLEGKNHMMKGDLTLIR